MNTLKLLPTPTTLLVSACAALLPSVTSAVAGDTNEWRFDVSLDGKQIGYHRYALSVSGAERTLRSEARYNVKLLFINAYSYAHTAEEKWQGECLSRLEARTNDNGHKKHVTATRNHSAFVVTTGTTTAMLAPCVQTFAYWNPRILTATHLLNPQTGEHVPVRVARIGTETMEVRGRSIAAERYRLVSEPTALSPLQIDLWYSISDAESRQWLALESIVEGGGRLQYKLQ